MTYAKIAYLLLKLADAIYSTIDRERLISLGQDRQTAKALLVLSENAKVLRDVDERIDHMTDAQIREQLDRDNDFRD